MNHNACIHQEWVYACIYIYTHISFFVYVHTTWGMYTQGTTMYIHTKNHNVQNESTMPQCHIYTPSMFLYACTYTHVMRICVLAYRQPQDDTKLVGFKSLCYSFLSPFKLLYLLIQLSYLEGYFIFSRQTLLLLLLLLLLLMLLLLLQLLLLLFLLFYFTNLNSPFAKLT